jgi:hypothetical protein
VRGLRLTLGALAFLLLALAAAAWLVPPLLDWNRYRGTIEILASETLGRDVRIAGPVTLLLLPQPVLTARDVTLGGTGAGVEAKARELRLRVALQPLLAGHLDPRELVLRGPAVHLPWPLSPDALAMQTPAWLSAVTARVEDGTLAIGGLELTGIDATLSTAGWTGTYAAAGTAKLHGHTWRFTARLTRAGDDGAAGVDVTLDGQGTAQGAGAVLTGQIAADGSFAGRITGRGPNLGLLMPAPAVPFRADGRVSIAGGLAAADDLAFDIGGSPMRGAVAVRVSPVARVDVALAASRIDLDAWLAVLLRPDMAIPDLPMGIDLSAEAAGFAGGTLRRLRAAVDIDGGNMSVREVRAELPGDAALRMHGRVLRDAAGTRFEGDGSLAAPALGTTLAWMQASTRLPFDELPAEVLRSANFSGHAVVQPGQVTLSQLSGTLDGAKVTGRVTLGLAERPSLAADLSFDTLSLDPWLDRVEAALPAGAAGLAAVPALFRRGDLALRLDAKQARLRGLAVDKLVLEAAGSTGGLALRRLDATVEGVHVTASGSVGEGGRIADGRLDIQAPQASLLVEAPAGGEAPADLWPPLAAAMRGVPGLLRGKLALDVQAAGPPEALALRAVLDAADARLEAQPVIDLPGRKFAGAVTLRHPGAPRLLEQAGVSGVTSWLGDGSLSLVAQISGQASPDDVRIAAGSLALTAGSLRASGALALDHAGDPAASLSGQIVAETLPLPLLYARSPAPLPTRALLGWRAGLKLEAHEVLAGLTPVMQNVAATVSLADGVLRVGGLTGQVAGGALAAEGSLNAAAEPPVWTLKGALTDAEVTAPLLDLPLDVGAGKLDLAADLTASGHAPAALLATLAGTGQATLKDGSLLGVSLGRATGKLEDADVQAALSGGSTPVRLLNIDVTLKEGSVHVTRGALESPAGTGTISGTLDLPGQTADLVVSLTPAIPAAPDLVVRLAGSLDALKRSLDLTGLARWRAGAGL